MRSTSKVQSKSIPKEGSKMRSNYVSNLRAARTRRWVGKVRKLVHCMGLTFLVILLSLTVSTAGGATQGANPIVYLGQNTILYPPYNYSNTGSDGGHSPGNSNGDAKVDLAAGTARAFWEGVGSDVYPARGDIWAKIGITFSVVQGNSPSTSLPATIRFHFRYNCYLGVAVVGSAEMWIYAHVTGPTGEVEVVHKVDYIGATYPNGVVAYDYSVTLQSGSSYLAYLRLKTYIWSLLGASMSDCYSDAQGRRLTLDSIAVLFPNIPPNIPSQPSGPTSGTVGTSYAYSTSATDPNRDQVKYTFDWGDGTTTTTNLVNSGTTASASHSWSTAGTYSVKAKATDSNGAKSGWSASLTVVIAQPLRPDLTYSDFYAPAPGQPPFKIGDKLYYWVHAKNIGQAPSGEWEDKLELFKVVGGTEQLVYSERKQWMSFPPGHDSDRRAGTNYTFQSAGAYKLRLTADPDNKIPENSGENNNKIETAFNVEAPPGAVILSVTGLGDVLYSGAPDCHTLTIRSAGPVIEWSLESGGSYTQGEVAANSSSSISIPHYKTFTLTIARPTVRKMGWIHARENDCKLAVIKNAGPGTAVVLASGGTLLDVANLGNVKATGPGSTVTIRSTGNVIEWSLESGGTYTQGEVAVNGLGTLSIPHYRTFTLTIARPIAGLIGAIHCRENDSIVVCTAGSATGKVGNGSGGVLLDVPGLGNIKATGPGNTVTITSTGNVIEWSLESGDSYQGGEVLVGQSRTITIPHWKTFTLTIARPFAGLIGAMRCRENDGWIVCLKGSAFVPL